RRRATLLSFPFLRHPPLPANSSSRGQANPDPHYPIEPHQQPLNTLVKLTHALNPTQNHPSRRSPSAPPPASSRLTADRPNPGESGHASYPRSFLTLPRCSCVRRLSSPSSPSPTPPT